MAKAETIDATIWTDQDRIPWVDQILKAMKRKVNPVAMGGPRLTELSDMAMQWKCTQENDPRKLLTDQPTPYVLLATTTGITRSDLDAAIQQGSVILTLEPPDPESDEPLNPPSTDPGETGRVVLTPSFRHASAWAKAANPEELLGTPLAIEFTSLGQTHERSLYARLVEAWQTILSLGGSPIQIDASITGPLTTIPEHPSAITGNLGVHARMDNGCLVVLHISDHAGSYERRLIITGDAGHIRVTDRGYSLFDAEGNPLDSQNDTKQPSLATLVARHWTHLLDHPTTAAEPATASETQALICCKACLLSARTGQPENPQKLLERNRY